MADSNQDEEIIRLDPTEIGYKDRKMVKWMGFILSDHTEMIEEMMKENEEVPAKPQLDEVTISKRLRHSYETQQVLAIQLNFICDGKFEEDVIGYVAGYHDQQVFIQTPDDFVGIDPDLIRHVDVAEAKKWFDQD